VATLVGSLVINEKLTLNILIGSLITIIGVFLVNQSLQKQKEAIKTIADADGM
jgi:drug/metabolite transporter (DMT)-like permease